MVDLRQAVRHRVSPLFGGSGLEGIRCRPAVLSCISNLFVVFGLWPASINLSQSVPPGDLSDPTCRYSGSGGDSGGGDAQIDSLDDSVFALSGGAIAFGDGLGELGD